MNFNPINTIRTTVLGLAIMTAGTACAQNDLPFTSTPVSELDSPWAMEFLPDGKLLITEVGGTLQLVTQSGEKTEISGVPTVDREGQGGLGDVVLHPNFSSNNTIYISYSEPGDNNTRGAAVARATLNTDSNSLENVEVIWRALPKISSGLHFSHRMVFDADGHLFVTAGDRNMNVETPETAPGQSLEAHLGKIHRLNDDGSPAAGNPFAGQGEVADDIWSWGHRNPLGIAIDAQGRIWNSEMGPRGGDELNLVEAGKNYGYPWVSNGNHYNGKDIPDHDTRPEFEDPKVWWNPVISPSSLMFYSGDKFPAWQGDAFLGGLSSQALVRVEVEGDSAREAERYGMGKRIRAVEQGPDGYIWLLEDGEGGRLLKLMP